MSIIKAKCHIKKRGRKITLPSTKRYVSESSRSNDEYLNIFLKNNPSIERCH